MKNNTLLRIWLLILLLLPIFSLLLFGFSFNALLFFYELIKPLQRGLILTFIGVSIFFLIIQPVLFRLRGRSRCQDAYNELYRWKAEHTICAENYGEYLALVERLDSLVSSHLEDFPRDETRNDMRRFQKFADVSLNAPAPD